MDFDYWERPEDSDQNHAELESDASSPSPITATRFLKRASAPIMREVLLTASTASAYPTYNIKDKPAEGHAICTVCGDGHAKLHYGILACYGCKGFFRRTLTGKYRYTCRFGNNCIVDKYQRNSCRYCRFQRCLEVGMDPKAVRPDRDLTGRQRVPRMRKWQIDEELLNHMMRLQGEDWTRKLPVESRMLLMQLMNTESKVAKGDEESSFDGGKNDPQNNNVSLRELFEQKPVSNNHQIEVRYEPYRMASVDELPQIAHRRAIAAVEWVDSLAEIADILSTEDKVAIVKTCYSPLTILNFSARTARSTKNPDILCLCNFSYVPRKLPIEFSQTNQLSHELIDRTLNELVVPLRKLNLKDEELLPLKAIVILNPNAKGLSPVAQQSIMNLRDRVQEMLFQVVKELYPAYSASSRFGNLLLLVPTIVTLSGIMSENLQFVQASACRQNGDHLLSEMFSDARIRLDEMVTSTSSPTLIENPAEISLHSVGSTQRSSSVSSSASPRTDTGTQTDFDDLAMSLSLSSNSLSKSLTSPSHVSLSSFHNLLDDDLNDFSPSGRDYPVLNECDDLLSLWN